MFIGKNGTGLMTYSEFIKVLEEALQSKKLRFKTHSAAFLDESIDFGNDAALLVECSANSQQQQIPDH